MQVQNSGCQNEIVKKNTSWIGQRHLKGKIQFYHQTCQVVTIFTLTFQFRLEIRQIAPDLEKCCNLNFKLESILQF